MALVTATPSSAQVTFGFRAGTTHATIGGDGAGASDGRTGLHVGGFVMLGLAPTIDLQVGGVFVQKGARREVEGVDVVLAIDYAEIPVLLRFGLPSAGVVSPHLFVGPAVSLEAACEAEASAPGFTGTLACDDAGIETAFVDVGAVAGAGVAIGARAPVNLSLDVFYAHGLRSVVVTPAADVKNRAWSFVASVGFPL